MKVFKPVMSVVLQEVPGHISLGFMAAGCPHGCHGCSYKTLKETHELGMDEFLGILSYNSGLASAVLFMGGEWSPDIIPLLDAAKGMGYATCLYTGKEFNDLPDSIRSRLDFCKTGRWEGRSLRDKDTNQRFIRVADGQDLTARFRKTAS